MKKADVAQYTFIMYKLGRMGVSQSALATRIGVTPAFVNMVIQGKRVSKKVEEAIASELGYPSWVSLRNAIADFEARLCGTEVSHA